MSSRSSDEWRVTVTADESPPTLVAWGRNLALPIRFVVNAEGLYRVRLKIHVAEDGPSCQEVCCEQMEGGIPVAADALRRVPLGRLVRDGLRLAAWRPLARDETGLIIAAGSFATGGEVDEAQRETVGAKRRWQLTDEHLAEVALVYTENRRNAKGVRAPTAAVEEHFSVPRSTAGRWVAAARTAGLLPAITTTNQTARGPQTGGQA
jgi:hypothetical protein